MKFVVIGGDAAGMSAASRAKRKMPDLEVTVLEQSQGPATNRTRMHECAGQGCAGMGPGAVSNRSRINE